jgi:hypothetical protein
MELERRDPVEGVLSRRRRQDDLASLDLQRHPLIASDVAAAKRVPQLTPIELHIDRIDFSRPGEVEHTFEPLGRARSPSNVVDYADHDEGKAVEDRGG